MKYTRLLTLVAGAALAFSGALLATPSPAAQSSTKKVTAASTSLRGTVKSISDSQLVVTEKGKDLTFSLNSDTQKVGDLKAGAEVNVQYHFDNGKDLATHVQVIAKH